MTSCFPHASDITRSNAKSIVILMDIGRTRALVSTVSVDRDRAESTYGYFVCLRLREPGFHKYSCNSDSHINKITLHTFTIEDFKQFSKQ